MKIPIHSKGNLDGYSLMIVMLFMGVGLAILTSAMNWTSNNAKLTARNNEFFTSVAAAEAATEKVLSYMALDYKTGGEARIALYWNSYSNLIPTSIENSFWTNYQFSNAMGTNSKTYVNRISATNYINCEAQYTGLKAFGSEYRVISNAQKTNSSYKIRAAVQQKVQLVSIPIFQFAVFYNGDLEVNPGQPMNIKGRVHSNGNIWNGGSDSLTYWDEVTSGERITQTRHPLDDTGKGGEGGVIYKQEKLKKTNELAITLPIGNLTNDLPQILKVPPAGESRTSELGVQRYYNKAELIILVTDTNFTLIAQNPTNGVTKVITNIASPIAIPTNIPFITTTSNFIDQREGNKRVTVTEINIEKLNVWSATNTALHSVLPASLNAKPVNLIYVADKRASLNNTTKMTAVRLISGQTLSARGLTVATENPLYVKGHFNADNSDLGTDDTSLTKPASLISDALTVLSGKWNDADGGLGLDKRKAEDTTVNAAILTGIVSTTNSPSRYSGGVQNVARFLEDWKNKTLTYNGSIVVLFDSIKATFKFQQPGAYYEIPNRNFNFDKKFTSSTNLPPGTPELRTLIRTDWATVPPNKTNYVKVF